MLTTPNRPCARARIATACCSSMPWTAYSSAIPKAATPTSTRPVTRCSATRGMKILSRKIADVLAPEEESRLALAIAKLAEGEVTRNAWRFRRKDGSEVVGEVVGRQLPDGHLLGILRDITERRQTEETMRKNAALTRLASDAARMTYAEFDFTTGRLQLAENFARVMGYTLPALTEQADIAKTRADMLSHIAPEYREQVQTANS